MLITFFQKYTVNNNKSPQKRLTKIVSNKSAAEGRRQSHYIRYIAMNDT